MREEKRKQRVFVGLSGGVDSAVAAALLKKAGHDVTGVFIKIGEAYEGCTWREDRRDAMRVAAVLEIPLLTLDLEQAYQKSVVDYMLAEYKTGRTPNPDVMCNREIKFGHFFDWAMAGGADFVATGHYAKIKKLPAASYQLLASRDQNKDQTYFLWTLTHRELTKTLSPIGDYKKPEVRKLAKKFDLPVADKKDSQGLCFIGQLDVKDFLKQHLPVERGAVLNNQGEIIGEHEGAHFYTLGERHGFTITKKTPSAKPYYVVAKNVENNTLTASSEPLVRAAGREVNLTDLNWISGERPGERGLTARLRYRAPLEPCHLNGQLVTFSKPVLAAPGQSCVFYRGEECLGGGVIA